jgi:hypothetical protein
MKFNRFTKPQILKGIGRPMLGKLFGRFNDDLAARKIPLPTDDLDDDGYYSALAAMVLAPDGLPPVLIEALVAIEGMATAEGQERLERAAKEHGFDFRADATGADMAVQAWLANPEMLTRLFNAQRLSRLSAFDYFGGQQAKKRGDASAAPFAAPSPEVLALIQADLEKWFRVNHRGEQAVRVEMHVIEGEYWFMIRHGDTYSRVPTVANGRMSILHFRPTKDDVVAYSPEHDEIRIHAQRQWEKKLYRDVFGHLLFGDPFYFTARKGPDALDVDVAGIEQVVLRELEVAWPGFFKDSTVYESRDLFASAMHRKEPAIPAKGHLLRACFDFHFSDSSKPRKVQVGPPNILKLGRDCDAALVKRFLVEAGFRGKDEVRMMNDEGGTLAA